MFRNKRALTVLALLIVVAIFISWGGISYFQHRGKVGVTVAVLPEDSILKIDGNVIKPGSVHLEPGTHTLTASREGFDDDTEVINTDDIEPDQVIYLLPAPKTAEAFALLNDTQGLQQEREAAGGSEAARIQELLEKKYPIITKLPYETINYKIGYGLEEGNKLVFYIDLYAIINHPDQYAEYKKQLKQYRDEALQYLTKNNINPAEFDIIYTPEIEAN